MVTTRINLMTEHAVNWRSRSFKVINFCCNRKPIYDLLLVINCHRGSLSHRFRASRSREPPHPNLSPQIKGPVRIFHQASQVKIYVIELHFSENCIILTSAVLSQYTRVTYDGQTDRRQTTYYDNSWTLKWNCNGTANKTHPTAYCSAFFWSGCS